MKFRKPFLEHLEDLRWTLAKIILTLVLATGVMFYFAPYLLEVVLLPLRHAVGNAELSLKTLRPTSGFLIALKVAFCFAMVLTLPLIFYFCARFFAPALKKQERRLIAPVFFFGALLFSAGVSFCYFVVMPLILRFLWGYTESLNLANDWTIEYYVTFVVGMILIFGVVFELPILILGLVQASILTPEFLRQKRAYAIILILVLAAVLTPPDVISQILLAAPMLILYEACIWGARFIKK